MERHIQPNAALCYKYHGIGRESNTENLTEFDIIFTTYATVTSEFCRGLSVLHQIRWFRIVLDEGRLLTFTQIFLLILEEYPLLTKNAAHVIRHQSTKQFRAIHELESKFRWCLTGTPIQNSLEDLASLVKFLRIPQLDTMTMFRKHVILPVEKGRGDCLRNLRLLLDSLCLRRTKELLNLPEPIETLQWIQLSPTEEEIYTKIGEESRMEIEAAVSVHKATKAYSSVLRALLRLRLLCNNGTYQSDTLKTSSPSIPIESSDGFLSFQESSQVTCAYCSKPILFLGISEDPSSAYLTSCNHLICAECLRTAENELDWNLQDTNSQCSSCAEEVFQYITARCQISYDNKPNLGTPGLLPIGADNGQHHSSKISALLSNIEKDMDCQKRFVHAKLIQLFHSKFKILASYFHSG